MADVIPTKIHFSGADPIGIDEFQTADTLGIAHGGTGATTAAGARTALDVSQIGHTHSYIPTTEKGANSGVATLDSGGKVPAAQLPSYVDDVLEVANAAALPGTGAAGIIYVTLDDNKCFRWTGTVYVEVSPSIGTDLGYTASTRVLTSNTGTDVTLPLMGTDPGLVPTSAGGTTNFLRADGTWNAPAGGGAAITVLDEGVSKTTALTSLDFVGAGVAATNTGGAVTVTISGGGSATGGLETNFLLMGA